MAASGFAQEATFVILIGQGVAPCSPTAVVPPRAPSSAVLARQVRPLAQYSGTSAQTCVPHFSALSL